MYTQGFHPMALRQRTCSHDWQYACQIDVQNEPLTTLEQFSPLKNLEPSEDEDGNISHVDFSDGNEDIDLSDKDINQSDNDEGSYIKRETLQPTEGSGTLLLRRHQCFWRVHISIYYRLVVYSPKFALWSFLYLGTFQVPARATRKLNLTPDKCNRCHRPKVFLVCTEVKNGETAHKYFHINVTQERLLYWP